MNDVVKLIDAVITDAHTFSNDGLALYRKPTTEGALLSLKLRGYILLGVVTAVVAVDPSRSKAMVKRSVAAFASAIELYPAATP